MVVFPLWCSKKQGNTPSNQFLAFILVGKWMAILSYTQVQARGMGSPVRFLTVERGPLRNSYVQLSSKYILMQSLGLHSRLHLSSKHHCKWNIRYKEMNIVSFCFSCCHVEITWWKISVEKVIQLWRPFLRETMMSLEKGETVKCFLLLNMFYSNWKIPNEDILSAGTMFISFPCKVYWADETDV